MKRCIGKWCKFCQVAMIEVQKCCQIVCAHKLYFLMPGHKSNLVSVCTSCVSGGTNENH